MATINNAFDERIAALNQIERILMTDTLTIAQFIANRRKYLLRNREPLIKDKTIGFMDSVSSHVKAVAKLTNVIQIKNKQEINQKKYLKGLAIKHIDEIATKLHRFTHNQSKPAIFLWEFTLYSLIHPQVIITHKNPSKIGSYPNIWGCKNKLTIKSTENTSISSKSHPAIFYCYAQLIPLKSSMPTFNICTSPFIIGRRSNINNKQIWPSSIRNAISAKHATIRHNFGDNTTIFQRNSKVNDMTINNTEPVLEVDEIATLKHKDKIEIINGIIYQFKLLQQKPWAQNVPHYLQNKHQNSRKQSNMQQLAQQRNSTPPPPRMHYKRSRESHQATHKQHAHRMSDGPSPPNPYRQRHQSPPVENTRINRRLNFSGDFIDLTQNDDGLMISRLPQRNVQKKRNNHNHNHKHIAASLSPSANVAPTQTQPIYNQNKARHSRKRIERNYIPESNLREEYAAHHHKHRDNVHEPPSKRARTTMMDHRDNGYNDIITKTPLKMRNSYDLQHVNIIHWISHRLLVFARYCLNPEIQCLSGAKVSTKPLPHGALLHIKKKMKGTALVFHKQVGSLLTRHAHIQSFLESILILHGGKCNLNIEYLALDASNMNRSNNGAFPGIICDEIKIGNMGSGYCMLLIFVVEKATSMMTHNGLSRLLVKLEQLDLELCSNGINVKYLYGIITDGCLWNVVRRKNNQRHVAKDVLNDPLLVNNKYFDIHKVLSDIKNNIGNKEENKEDTSKFNQIAASLAQERWQLFKSRYEFGDYDDSVLLRDKALYDGYVLNCDISNSSSKLHEISRVIHGLIYEQRVCFGEAFKIALRHNSALNRPAINPYHDVNRNEQKKKCDQYLSLCDQVYNVRDDYQQGLTQNDW